MGQGYASITSRLVYVHLDQVFPEDRLDPSVHEDPEKRKEQLLSTAKPPFLTTSSYTVLWSLWSYMACYRLSKAISTGPQSQFVFIHGLELR